MSSPNGHAADLVRSDLREAISYGELLRRDVPPRPSLVAGLVDQGTGVILAGPPNVGKTWLTLALARAVAGGTDWLGRFGTTVGPVLVIDEESHLPGVQARARMLEAAEPLGPDLPISFAIGHGVRLDTQAGAGHIEALIRRHRPILTVMDSFTRLHGGSENDAGEMADVFAVAKALIRQHDTAILFTDHLRKKSLLNDPEEMLRGSTEKRAWSDSILFAAAGEPNTVAVSHVKARYGRRVDTFTVRLDIDEAGGTAHLTHVGAPANNNPARANELLDGIHALKRELGEDGADAVRLAAWLEVSPDTVRRHAKKLAEAGILRVRRARTGGAPKEVFDVAGGGA